LQETVHVAQELAKTHWATSRGAGVMLLRGFWGMTMPTPSELIPGIPSAALSDERQIGRTEHLIPVDLNEEVRVDVTAGL
jgi:hypothetical protein